MVARMTITMATLAAASEVNPVDKVLSLMSDLQAKVTKEGEEHWVQHCIDKGQARGDYFENCTPGYYNNEGKASERNAQNGFYGGGPVEFFRILSEWRAEGGLHGLALGNVS